MVFLSREPRGSKPQKAMTQKQRTIEISKIL